MFSSSAQKIALLIFCFIFLTSVLHSTESTQQVVNYPDTPTGTVPKYYQAINFRDCKTASYHRPGLDLKRCKAANKSVKTLDLKMVKLRSLTGRAIVHLELKIIESSIPAARTFNGFLRVNKNSHGRWVIDHTSYKNVATLKEYQGQSPPTPAHIVTRPLPAQKLVKWKTSKPIRAPIVPEGQFGPQPATPAPADNRIASPDRITRPNRNRDGTLKFGDADVLANCFSAQSLVHHHGEERINNPNGLQWLNAPEQLKARKMAALPPSRRRSIRSVNVGRRKLVALTFDFCEQNNEFAGYDGRIVDYLRTHRIKATMYMGGKWMATHEKRTMQMIADPLFELGNHGWTHGNLRYLKGRAMRNQIEWTQAQYELLRDKLQRKACYKQAKKRNREVGLQNELLTLRYPYGTCSNEALHTAANMGLPSIQWNVVTADPWRGQKVSGIVRATNKVRPGSIVIMHANGRGWKTSRALPTVVRRLKLRGYEFVTVSELLNAGKARTARTCYEVRPGDNKHYDRIFKGGTVSHPRKKKWKYRKKRRPHIRKPK